MTEIINIKVPISKSYFNTYLNSFISIHFFKDNQVSLENLKNLLFPLDYLDNEFNKLNDFIKNVCDDSIINGKDSILLRKDLIKRYTFDEDILSNILNVIKMKKKEILNEINKQFYEDEMVFKGINWGIKSVLASKNEENYNQRFADVEFSYYKANNKNECLRNKNITFMKSDLSKLIKELRIIKENLKNISNLK